MNEGEDRDLIYAPLHRGSALKGIFFGEQGNGQEGDKLTESDCDAGPPYVLEE